MISDFGLHHRWKCQQTTNSGAPSLTMMFVSVQYKEDVKPCVIKVNKNVLGQTELR